MYVSRSLSRCSSFPFRAAIEGTGSCSGRNPRSGREMWMEKKSFSPHTSSSRSRPNLSSLLYASPFACFSHSVSSPPSNSPIRFASRSTPRIKTGDRSAPADAFSQFIFALCPNSSRRMPTNYEGVPLHFETSLNLP